ncbi:unnamed protein product [Rotaria sp. Silwood2]|nr:unnamed protein product [Rotaria sp. Silwood2]CAF2745417.1 unnamed protein product [Rotaria sp. Silwood2]CAF2931107.1 unnamed protein product [Rotaria sp. Silwood2]CAF3134860.1 unnamed protein product [Rotaria sp. Silwood2]CAF3899007.1 unnamed protein product [Rotaria sp. Silwood2]
MPNKSSKLLTSKTVKKFHSPKKSTTTPFYSGIPSAQRALQQQRLLLSRHSTRAKRDLERITENALEDFVVPVHYHPWESKYHKTITREKFIKSMTKDSYTPIVRVISHAIENVTTETECSPVLIAAEAVKIETFNIQQAPRRSVPNVVRYLRRTEPMPPAPSFTPVKISSQSQHKKTIIPVMNTSKVAGTAPNLITTDRLLNRAKTHNDESVIRRPPRKLVLNVTHETIMPLSVFG